MGVEELFYSTTSSNTFFNFISNSLEIYKKVNKSKGKRKNKKRLLLVDNKNKKKKEKGKCC